MQVTTVEERDSAWEDPHPRIRVYLHSSRETTTRGLTDTFDITGANVLQVIDWAQRQAGDRLTYAVALVRDDADMERHNPGRAVAWCGPWAWTATTTRGPTPQSQLWQQRMLERVRQLVSGTRGFCVTARRARAIARTIGCGATNWPPEPQLLGLRRTRLAIGWPQRVGSPNDQHAHRCRHRVSRHPRN